MNTQEGRVKTEAEPGVLWPEAKGMLEAKSWERYEGSSPRPVRGSTTLTTP